MDIKKRMTLDKDKTQKFIQSYSPKESISSNILCRL